MPLTVAGVVTVNGQQHPVTDVCEIITPAGVFDTALFDDATFE